MSDLDNSTKRRRAKRWTPAQAREVIGRWKASGQTASAFSAQNGICVTRLSYWSKQLEQDPEHVPAFVAVALPSAPALSSVSNNIVEVEFSGAILRVREGADPRYVAQLVSALRSAERC